jgi:hypothetical protein
VCRGPQSGKLTDGIAQNKTPTTKVEFKRAKPRYRARNADRNPLPRLLSWVSKQTQFPDGHNEAKCRWHKMLWENCLVVGPRETKPICLGASGALAGRAPLLAIGRIGECRAGTHDRRSEVSPPPNVGLHPFPLREGLSGRSGAEPLDKVVLRWVNWLRK